MSIYVKPKRILRYPTTLSFPGVEQSEKTMNLLFQFMPGTP